MGRREQVHRVSRTGAAPLTALGERAATVGVQLDAPEPGSPGQRAGPQPAWTLFCVPKRRISKQDRRARAKAVQVQRVNPKPSPKGIDDQ